MIFGWLSAFISRKSGRRLLAIALSSTCVDMRFKIHNSLRIMGSENLSQDTLAEQLLELAIKSGAEAAEVYQSRSLSRPVFFEANRLKQLETNQSEGTALRLWRNGRWLKINSYSPLASPASPAPPAPPAPSSPHSHSPFSKVNLLQQPKTRKRLCFGIRLYTDKMHPVSFLLGFFKTFGFC